MEIKPIEVQNYKPDYKQWVIKPIDKFTGKNRDDLIYDMWVTPQMPNETDWCIFMVGITKQVTNSRFGKVVDCKIIYGFKIKALGTSLQTKFLNEVQTLAYEWYVKEWKERTKDIIHVQNLIFEPPSYDSFKSTLERVLLMIGVGRN
jgi:hypothetical protein